MNIRKQRGYSFEHELVNRINKVEGWIAIRLGSPSISLPDIIAVNNGNSTLLAIEAKSSSSDIITIPVDQIMRCLRILNTFAIYENKYAIIALKFMSKKWRGRRRYTYRELREYYYVLNNTVVNDDIKCKYDGSLYYYYSNDKLSLQPYTMPWQ